MNVIVTGSLGFDYIMDFSGRFADRIMPDKIHKISFSALVDTLTKQFGGTAGNISYSLKLLGVEPIILSTAGNDFRPYKDFFRRRKIRTDYIQEIASVVTGTYFVMTDRDDNQIGAFYRGALTYNTKLSLSVIKEKTKLVIIAPNEPAAMKRYVKECEYQKLPYVYDPAFQTDNFSAEELRDGIVHAAIFIGNDYEIALAERKLDISHEELRVMVPILITTLGSKGSIIETRRESVHCKPAKPKNISDPTGAGDAFRAGFIAGYLKGYDPQICGQMGSVAAVYTVEKYGSQTHCFTKKEFIKRYKENFGTAIKL